MQDNFFWYEMSEAIDPFDACAGAVCSRKTLALMRSYFDNYIVELPGPRYFNIHSLVANGVHLNEWSLEDISEICRNEKTKKNLHRIISQWFDVDPAVYLAFSKIEGWKEAFEEYYTHSYCGLPGFLKKLNMSGLLDAFIQDFGRDRINALLSRLKAIPQFTCDWKDFFSGNPEL